MHPDDEALLSYAACREAIERGVVYADDVTLYFAMRAADRVKEDYPDVEDE